MISFELGDVNITIIKANGQRRHDIPDKNETIFEDFEMSQEKIDAIKDGLIGLKIYKREDDCWICDQLCEGGYIFYIKLPVEMHEKEVMNYFKPLIDIFEEKLKEQKNKMN